MTKVKKEKKRKTGRKIENKTRKKEKKISSHECCCGGMVVLLWLVYECSYYSHSHSGLRRVYETDKIDEKSFFYFLLLSLLYILLNQKRIENMECSRYINRSVGLVLC